MLIRLLRFYLRPYRKPLAFLLVLQLAQTLATLYLPTLNADIIDNGVIFHNTHYILTTGGVMLAITLGADHLRDRRDLLRRPGRDGARPRCPAGDLPPGADVLRPGGEPPRHRVADHQDHQ